MRPSPPTHPSNQPSPHSQPPPPHSQMMSSQPFLGPRYPAGPRPGVRMPPQIGNDFNGVGSKGNNLKYLLFWFLFYSRLVNQ